MDYEALALKLGAKPAQEQSNDLAALAVKFGAKPAPPSPQDAIDEAQTNPEVSAFGQTIKGETDGGFNPAAMLIGAGRLGDKLNQGYAQAKNAVNYAVGKITPGVDETRFLDELMAQKEREAQKDAQFAKLEMVHPGSTQAGQIAPLLPAGPAAMTALAAAEYGSPQERATRVAATVAGNKLAKVAGKTLGARANDLATSRIANAQRDAEIAALKQEGFKALPSEAGGNLTGRLMEGTSGQIKTKQAMQVANQPVSNRIALAEAGAEEGADATYKVLKEARAKAYKEGYEPLIDLWGDRVRLKPSDSFKADIGQITSRADKASNAFGDAVKSDVSGLVEKVKEAKPFTVDEAMGAISIWREKASDAYRLGDRDMGKAYRKLAESLEDEIGRHLTKSKNADLLVQYQKARKTIAKNFNIEAALVEGRGVDVQKLAKMYAKNPEKFSDGTLTLAKAGTRLKDSTGLPKQGGELPISALDAWGASMGQIGGTVASLLTGNPIPAMIPLATIGGRVGARKGLISGAGQRMFATPNYDPSLLLRGERALLENEFAPQAGGLLGYYFANR